MCKLWSCELRVAVASCQLQLPELPVCIVLFDRVRKIVNWCSWCSILAHFKVEFQSLFFLEIIFLPHEVPPGFPFPLLIVIPFPITFGDTLSNTSILMLALRMLERKNPHLCKPIPHTTIFLPVLRRCFSASDIQDIRLLPAAQFKQRQISFSRLFA